MRIFIAKIFRQLFKLNFFKPKFYGIYQRIFKPFRLFKGVECTVNYNGFKLRLKLDDWIQQNIYFLGTYEEAEIKAVENILKPGTTFLDLGANLGLYSLHASRAVGENGKVISFEPFSVNYNAIKEHIHLNHLKNVQLEKLAVGKERGSITLYHNESEENLGMVSANYIENAVKEEVKVVSIDAYLKTHPQSRIDFIKIDIEGFELPTLLGMENTLKEFAPTILIEILEDSEGSNNSEKVNDFLKSLAYEKYYISDEGEILSSAVDLHRKNYLFINVK